MQNRSQYLATNPSTSAWVSASAGTGKTKILIDRILRLLLEDINPDQILCLTFTNAAAGEMLARINKALKNWAQLSDKELTESLQVLTDKVPNRNLVLRARNLFKEQIFTGKSLNIYTIHAFCQNILQKFPYEAGINSSFKVIDELKANIILKEEVNKYLAHKANIGHFLKYISIFKIKELLIEAVSSIHNISASAYDKEQNFNQDHDRFSQILYQYFGVDSSVIVTEDLITKCRHQFIQQLKCSTLNKLIISHPEIELFIPLKEFINKTGDTYETFIKLIPYFLTVKGEIRKKLLPKKLADSDQKLANQLANLQQIYFDTIEQLKLAEIIQKSQLLYDSAIEIYQKYERRKMLSNYLDYNDLISYTYYLICHSNLRQWVQYKLDGGTHHVLIDEAQDTSGLQWQIIYNLIVDFFSGHSSHQDIIKTIFVVGDVKQSIYSFQGARPDLFLVMKSEISQLIIESKQRFINLELEITYRLPPAILTVLHQIFARQPSINYPMKHVSQRSDAYGKVELWPLIDIKIDKDFFWPLPEELKGYDSPAKQLAINIAKFVKDTLDQQTYLCSQQRVVEPKDFLILVRQRSEFVELLTKELSKCAIPIAGVDRLNLMENLAVRDLISAAKFSYNQVDDLNLACLLKSPIFQLTDNDLIELCCPESGTTIWERINSRAEKFSASLTKISFKEMKLNNSINYPALWYRLQIIIEFAYQYSPAQFFRQLIYRFQLLRYYTLQGKYDFVDALQEFILLTQQLQGQEQFNLAQLVDYLLEQQVEIKRELSNINALKIMTVHGAKGLQAPIVIIADITSINFGVKNTLLHVNHNEDAFIWPNRSSSHSLVEKIKNQNKENEYQEYLRLFYVAMTRAEDQLIITGIAKKEKNEQESWYHLAHQALKEIGRQIEDGKLIYESNAQYSKDIRESSQSLITISSQEVVLEDYSKNSTILLPLIELNAEKILRHYNNEPQSSNEDILKVNIDSVNFGTVLHKILEDYVKCRDIKVIEQHHCLTNLTNEQRLVARQIIHKAINTTFFQEILGHQLRAEVNVGGIERVEDIFKVGRIDLLVIKDHNIIIVDYKSDSTIPDILPDQYRIQINYYIDAIKHIFPDKEVEAYILWLRYAKWQVIDAGESIL